MGGVCGEAGQDRGKQVVIRTPAREPYRLPFQAQVFGARALPGPERCRGQGAAGARALPGPERCRGQGAAGARATARVAPTIYVSF
ncbi:MAG: hypothetical protein IMW89_18220 [Ktedonobacteraceae bacterium]|nr:hypothetical protein [Ktedonobacteraceae bacterium]